MTNAKIFLAVFAMLMTIEAAYPFSSTFYPDQSTKAGYQSSTPTAGFPYSTSNYCCCYSAANSPTWPNEFDVGYICYQHAGPYYTRIYRRDSFRFNIGAIPTGVTITSASFNAYATRAYNSWQDVHIYSSTNDAWTTNNDHSATFTSSPGCASAFDPGSLTYQGTVNVASAGWKSWGVTSFIQSEKNAGQTYATLHLRGATESNTNCGCYRCYEFNEVYFSSPGTGNQPYLSVTYYYPDGAPCSAGSDCVSGNCKADYDGSGSFCSPATSCAHNGVAYANGANAPDCCDANQRRYCNAGNWACASCGTDACAGTCGTGTNSCVWRDYYCSGGSCGQTDYDDDGAQARCDACKGAGYWSIGGEVAGTACCGDDSAEYKGTRSCNAGSGCTTDGTDDACCAASTDCIYSSTCYDNAWTGTAPWNGNLRVSCSGGSWALIEDCSTKATADTDGGNVPATAGTLTDYTTSGGASCNSNTYTDTCASTTALTEYYVSGTSYGSQAYSCTDREVNATDTDGGDNPASDGTCTGGTGASCATGAFTQTAGSGGTDTCTGTCGTGADSCVYTEYYPGDSADACTGLDTCTSKTYSADTNSNTCNKCKGAGYWNIGGEVAGTACCGDDSGEYKKTRQCTTGCTTNGTDDACCNANNDCAYSSACYSNGQCLTNQVCTLGSWADHCSNGVKDCDEEKIDCGGVSCAVCPTNIIFSYRANDYQRITGCSLWTNLSGTWEPMEQDYTILSGVTSNFTLSEIIPPGIYSWNVQCNDSLGQSMFAPGNGSVTVP